MASKPTLACACVCAVTVALAGAATLRAEPTPEQPADALAMAPAWAQWEVQRLIDRYRHQTWRWQRTMGRKLTRRLTHPPADTWAKIALWKRVAARTRRSAQNPPHKRAWLCIHRHEAAWHDQGAPYYGGLQMDLSFQRAYGRHLLARKGTADRWTPLEQMWVAERAFKTCGFWPWPNTARACGLI
jgi:hypothetical protein